MTNHTEQASLPIIATMMGDPSGIGPEIVAKALATGEPQKLSRCLVIGSIDAFRQGIGYAGVDLKTRVIKSVAEAQFTPGVIDVLDPGTLSADQFETGKPSAAAGHAVLSWMDMAKDLSQRGVLAGWIMAPIDRTAIKMATNMPDEDEMGPAGSHLFRISGPLRIVPVVEHMAIRQVPDYLTQERVFSLVKNVHETLERWGLKNPRIAVCALNAHARGEEEEKSLKPAVAQAQALGIKVHGPVSPDAVFRQNLEGKHDVVVSMYHDQGQIALKTTAFAGACSIYLGVPYLYVTVPHGSAYDIAGKGIAQHLSVLSAMRTAAALAAGKFALIANG